VKRTRVVAALGVITVSLGWVAFKGVTGNLVYYKTPTELLSEGTSAVGQRVRLGGLVEPDSLQRSGEAVRFLLGDGTTRMTVIDTAPVPALFQEGRGVVVEGTYGADGAFHADTVIVKHSDRYSPPSPGQTPPPFEAG
jgi:cytochrome c-type biogenesis protein CcmE